VPLSEAILTDQSRLPKFRLGGCQPPFSATPAERRIAEERDIVWFPCRSSHGRPELEVRDLAPLYPLTGNTGIPAAEDSRARVHRSFFFRLRQLTEGLHLYRSGDIGWFNVRARRPAPTPPYLLYLVLLHFFYGTHPMAPVSETLPCQPWFRPRYPPSHWPRPQKTIGSVEAGIAGRHTTRVCAAAQQWSLGWITYSSPDVGAMNSAVVSGHT